MNAKTARKLRKHLEKTVDPNKMKEAEKALKILHKQGQVKFSK